MRQAGPNSAHAAGDHTGPQTVPEAVVESASESPANRARSHRRAETARLFGEAALADGEARDGLLEEVIRLNMVIASELARRYHGRGIAGDDLDQVANLGLDSLHFNRVLFRARQRFKELLLERRKQ